MAGLTDDITCIARELIDQLAQAGEVDLVSDFAVPFPLTVVARLLGGSKMMSSRSFTTSA